MSKLKLILNDEGSRAGKIFVIFIQCMIVLSLISFSVETLPDLSNEFRHYLHIFEVFSIIIFTLEYIGRVIVAEKKFKFIFSFFGLVDLFAILPFYVSTGLDLRSLRSLRLLRIIRILKLARYSSAIQRFHRAFDMVKEELILFVFVTFIILYLAGVGIYFFENPAQPEVFSSVFHSLWWSVATLTSVGYGDIYPITVGGKVFTFFVLLIGLGIVSVPAAIMASALSKSRDIIK